jgi:phosphatidylglycerophosphate synthase
MFLADTNSSGFDMGWITSVMFAVAAGWMFAAVFREKIRKKIVWEGGGRMSRFGALAWAFFMLSWSVLCLSTVLHWTSIEQNGGWLVGPTAALVAVAMAHAIWKGRKERGRSRPPENNARDVT